MVKQSYMLGCVDLGLLSQMVVGGHRVVVVVVVVGSKKSIFALWSLISTSSSLSIALN